MNSKNGDITNDIKAKLYDIYIDTKKSLSKIELGKLTNGTDEDIDPSTEILVLIKYIEIYINYILQEKNEFKNYKNNKENIRQLESYIIKLEDDIKYHIAKQYQNKIYKDSLEMKLGRCLQIQEDYEELKEKVRYEDGKFMENDRKENEIIILRRENSNLKKEISKMNRKYEALNKLEQKNKELERIHIDDEENIKNLNLKIDQLNNRISDLEKELNYLSNRFNSSNSEYRKKININNNILDNNKFRSTRISFDKFNIKSTENISNNLENLYQQSLSFFNNEHKNLKSRTTKKIDSNLMKTNTANKIIMSNKIMTEIKNNVYKSVKKRKSNNSMRTKEKGGSDLLSKYLSKENSNYINYSRYRSLERIDQNFLGYKFHLSNNSVGRKKSKNKGNNKNKNIIYEHSALNILAMNRKYKI